MILLYWRFRRSFAIFPFSQFLPKESVREATIVSISASIFFLLI